MQIDFLAQAEKESQMKTGQDFFKCLSRFQFILNLWYATCSAGEDSSMQNMAAELFEMRISYILSTWMSKLQGAFHHWCNKNGPFFFLPQTEEHD